MNSLIVSGNNQKLVSYDQDGTVTTYSSETIELDGLMVIAQVIELGIDYDAGRIALRTGSDKVVILEIKYQPIPDLRSSSTVASSTAANLEQLVIEYYKWREALIVSILRAEPQLYSAALANCVAASEKISKKIKNKQELVALVEKLRNTSGLPFDNTKIADDLEALRVKEENFTAEEKEIISQAVQELLDSLGFAGPLRQNLERELAADDKGKAG